MIKNIKDQILDKVRSVPSIPTAASKVIGLLQDPEVEINELMKTIEYDPGLTSNVLRLANSAYFAGPRTISTLREAIMRLGTNRIFQLVITSAIVPLARQPVKGYDIAAGKLLEHSIAVAIGGEELASQLGLRPPAHTFTAGLLHDLGKIVLGTFLAIDAAPILKLAYEEQLSFEVAETRVLGIDHAEAGAVLLETWNLPMGLVDAVRFHHRPEEIGERPEGTLVVDLVHVADNLALESGVGTGIDGLNYHPSPAVTARLKLRADAAEAVLCNMVKGMEELRDILGSNMRR